MKLISKLRKKPKHVRDNIAFAAAGVVTLPIMAYVIFGLHGQTFTNTIAGRDEAGGARIFETFLSQVGEQVATARQATAPAETATSTKPVEAVIDRSGLDAVPVTPLATTSTSSVRVRTSTTSSPLEDGTEMIPLR